MTETMNKTENMARVPDDSLTLGDGDIIISDVRKELLERLGIDESNVKKRETYKPTSSKGI